MCARKAEREERPDSKTRATQDFAWQHFEIVDEQTVIAEIAGFLRPSYVRQGGYARKMALESVRSAIKRARKNRLIRQRVSNNPNSLLVKDFLAWACNHWTSLQTVIQAHGATVQLFAPDAMQSTVSPPRTFELILPKDHDALAAEYRKLHELWRDESRARIDAEKELETYKRADKKRRTDGAKRDT